MRTLFLIGILAILVLIATKKPNQTAWEAADGFAENVKIAIGNVRDDPSSSEKKSVVKQVEDALSDIKLNEPVRPSKGVDRSTKRTDVSSGKVQSKTPTPEISGSEGKLAKSDKSKWKFPLPLVPDAPKLPAIPRSPVQVSEIGEDAPAPEQVASSINNYGDVRSFYENASRLLQEIK
jgi:hypothetical protein